MATKNELIRTIVRELRIAQEEDWTPPPEGRVGKLVFPPALPTGTGFELPATDELLRAVAAYADVATTNENVLKKSHRRSDWYEVVRRSFGEAIFNAAHGYEDDALVPALRSRVDAMLADEIAITRSDVDLVLGCWVFENSKIYPVTVGPVCFSSRIGWIDQAHRDGRISTVTHRRLISADCKKRISARSRKSWDAYREQWIVEAIDNCPVVCTVQTNGISSKLVPEKGARAARLAMTALALMWDRPSQGLSWMHLAYDGPVYHRRYVLFSGDRAGGGSSLSHMPNGYKQSDLTDALRRFQPYLDVLGEAISDYLVPHAQRSRPKLFDALFLSLWWYQQACREDSDQIATAKFAASMDALAGGQGSKGILSLIDARLGCEANKKIMPDGRTTKQVVEKIYKAGRSQLIHGSSRDFAEDWSGIRTTAETLGRHILLQVCDWLRDNPKVDDIDALRSKGA